MYEAENEKYTWDNPENPMKDFLYNLTKNYFELEELPDDEYLLENGTLIKAPSGKLWHILQAPPKWMNGSEVKEIANVDYNKWIYSKRYSINEIYGLTLNSDMLRSFATAPNSMSSLRLFDCYILDTLSRINFSYAGNCFFQRSIFLSNNVFAHRLIFSECNFHMEAVLNSITFVRGIEFEGCTFDSFIKINYSKIEGSFVFMNNNFTGKNCYLMSYNSTFQGNFSISYFRASDNEIIFNKYNFDKCNFDNDFSIGEISAGKISQEKTRFDQCTFTKTTTIDFGAPLLPSVFNNCHFKGPSSFTKPNFPNHRKELLPTGINDEINNEEGIIAEESKKEKIRFWKRMETGAQELRVINSSSNDKLSEWAYYDIEQYAKLQIAKLNKKFSPFNWLYEVLSQNGLSLTRPLLCLLVLYVFSTFIYLGSQAFMLMHEGDVIFSHKALYDGFIISGSQMVLGSFRGDIKWLDFIKDIENHNLALATFDRAIAFLQNLISIVLVFLFGLALRRRYQV